jgi:small subunit ribosomal protein S21
MHVPCQYFPEPLPRVTPPRYHRHKRLVLYPKGRSSYFRIRGLAYSPEGGDFSLAEVHIQDGETLESALRRFKRKVQQEDIIKEIKRHSFYLKPGEKKRTKEALARKRNRKKRSKDVE